MSAGRATRRVADAVRGGVATFLAIAGLVAIMIGVLYLLADGMLPHILRGASTTGHDLRRAVACLAGGAASVAVARLIRVRRRA